MTVGAVWMFSNMFEKSGPQFMLIYLEFGKRNLQWSVGLTKIMNSPNTSPLTTLGFINREGKNWNSILAQPQMWCFLLWDKWVLPVVKHVLGPFSQTFQTLESWAPKHHSLQMTWFQVFDIKAFRSQKEEGLDVKHCITHQHQETIKSLV